MQPSMTSAVLCVGFGKQKRASMVGQVLYGFYRIPTSVADPIDIVINPVGDEVRSLKRCATPLPSSSALPRHSHPLVPFEQAGVSPCLRTCPQPCVKCIVHGCKAS